MEVSKRTARIGELIRMEISDILREEVNDPRLELLSVTKVEINAELKHAIVYVSSIKEEDIESIDRCLKNARGFIQKMLGKRLKLRYTPIIEFRIDESIKQAAHIMEILEKFKKDKAINEE